MELSNLWNFVQGLTPAAPLAPSEVQIALAPFADKLVHLLRFKVRFGSDERVMEAISSASDRGRWLGLAGRGRGKKEGSSFFAMIWEARASVLFLKAPQSVCSAQLPSC